MTTPAKTRRTPAVPLEETPEFKAALAAAVAEALAKSGRVTGHRAYATKEISPACAQYAKWISREYPELYPTIDDVDARLLMIATKAYRWFQKSDLSLKAVKDGPETA